MRLVFLGYPGSGKGTVAGRIQKAYGVPAISTGVILREEIAEGTELGKQVKPQVEGGGLVPDELVARIVEGRLTEDRLRVSGFSLDGFPRTVPQAELLDRYLAGKSAPLHRAIYLEVDKLIILKRLTARRTCRSCGEIYNLITKAPLKPGMCDVCGGALYQREDDQEDALRKRMREYHAQTQPVLHYYQSRNVLSRVDGGGTPEEVFAEVERAVESDPIPRWKLTKFPR